MAALKLDTKITDFNGNEIRHGLGEEGRSIIQAVMDIVTKAGAEEELQKRIDERIGKKLTLREVMMTALMVGERQQGQNSKLDWMNNYKYLQMIATADEVDLDESSREYIFSQIEKNCNYTTMVMGQTRELLLGELKEEQFKGKKKSQNSRKKAAS